MARRLLDVLLSAAALVALAPLLVAIAVGIRVSSPGPILHRARRVGQNGRVFTMYKFRSMRTDDTSYRSVVTAADDPRVFPFGAWLRRSKADELPQLLNILRGEMSIVGPRPEDVAVVEKYYAPPHYEVLTVRPGLASPGSIYDYTHGEKLISRSTPEADYVNGPLFLKIALDIVYLRRRTMWYDARLVGRTIRVMAAQLLGQRTFPDPPETDEARRLLRSTAVALTHSPAREFR